MGEGVFVKGVLKSQDVLKQILLSEKCSSSFMKVVPFEDGDWIKKSEDLYWFCLLEIEGRSLDYSRIEERRLAVEKLAEFHAESFGLKMEGIRIVSLKNKWMNRLMKFEESLCNHPKRDHELIKRYTTLGRQVLEQMDEELVFMETKAVEEGCIIHGDPAHHNFVFNRSQLRLIDGDLISYAPREYDFLQLMNRMLPYSNWSLYEWGQYDNPAIKTILNKPYLVKLLAFPADFYREWLVDTDGREQLLQKELEQHEKRYSFMLNLFGKSLSCQDITD
ncbi:phosphotransferase [Guptibacillus algicola]|uniref:phosphotransferase n=1 Tax=Guptibacillus algicola TaxID=225844 RepID=UPI001CD5BD68|nr:phosphotransferase [Alkalihalobacillus algicola]MCA0986199.1 phosphotransferase [Alkalihalobacillus algicola]